MPFEEMHKAVTEKAKTLADRAKHHAEDYRLKLDSKEQKRLVYTYVEKVSKSLDDLRGYSKSNFPEVSKRANDAISGFDQILLKELNEFPGLQDSPTKEHIKKQRWEFSKKIYKFQTKETEQMKDLEKLETDRNAKLMDLGEAQKEIESLGSTSVLKNISYEKGAYYFSLKDYQLSTQNFVGESGENRFKMEVIYSKHTKRPLLQLAYEPKMGKIQDEPQWMSGDMRTNVRMIDNFFAKPIIQDKQMQHNEVKTDELLEELSNQSLVQGKIQQKAEKYFGGGDIDDYELMRRVVQGDENLPVLGALQVNDAGNIVVSLLLQVSSSHQISFLFFSPLFLRLS